jgi:hypothetical protein
MASPGRRPAHMIAFQPIGLADFRFRHAGLGLADLLNEGAIPHRREVS